MIPFVLMLYLKKPSNTYIVLFVVIMVFCKGLTYKRKGASVLYSIQFQKRVILHYKITVLHFRGEHTNNYV